MKSIILCALLFSFQSYACSPAAPGSCERKTMSKTWKWDDKKLVSLAACKNGKPSAPEEKKLKDEYIRYAKASMRYSHEQHDAFYFPANASDINCKHATKVFEVAPKLSAGLNDENVCLADLHMEIEANCSYVVFDEGLTGEKFNCKNPSYCDESMSNGTDVKACQKQFAKKCGMASEHSGVNNSARNKNPVKNSGKSGEDKVNDSSNTKK